MEWKHLSVFFHIFLVIFSFLNHDFYSIFFTGRRSNKHNKVEPKTNPIYHFLENEGLDLPVSSEGGNEFGLELKNRPEEPVSSDSEDEFGLVYKKRSKVPISSHSENEIGSEFNKEDNTETPNNENNDNVHEGNESESDKTDMVTPEPETLGKLIYYATFSAEALVFSNRFKKKF